GRLQHACSGRIQRGGTPNAPSIPWSDGSGDGAADASVVSAKRRRPETRRHLKMYDFDSPPTMSILEEATASSQSPMMGVFNNLVLFDQHQKQNRLDTIVPDLATGWSWSEDGTQLTLPLRQGVKWHDGQPFTAKDVVCTWDLMLETGKEKLRFNPRKSFYKNLDRVTANSNYEVTFH